MAVICFSLTMLIYSNDKSLHIIVTVIRLCLCKIMQPPLKMVDSSKTCSCFAASEVQTTYASGTTLKARSWPETKP